MCASPSWTRNHSCFSIAVSSVVSISRFSVSGASCWFPVSLAGMVSVCHADRSSKSLAVANSPIPEHPATPLAQRTVRHFSVAPSCGNGM